MASPYTMWYLRGEGGQGLVGCWPPSTSISNYRAPSIWCNLWIFSPSPLQDAAQQTRCKDCPHPRRRRGSGICSLRWVRASLHRAHRHLEPRPCLIPHASETSSLPSNREDASGLGGHPSRQGPNSFLRGSPELGVATPTERAGSVAGFPEC